MKYFYTCCEGSQHDPPESDNTAEPTTLKVRVLHYKSLEQASGPCAMCFAPLSHLGSLTIRMNASVGHKFPFC